MKIISIGIILFILCGGVFHLALDASKPVDIQKDFVVHGIDVSHHQGEIDWKKVNAQQYAFVFIKATEGGDFKDKRFLNNWQQARQQGLAVGAYHFYRNCKSGNEQAENFIATVPKHFNSLPPVIDVEFQPTCDADLTAEQLQKEIRTMAVKLEQHYGKRPILYTTPNYYKAYLKDTFDQYPLWLQDLQLAPNKADERPWIFWQYSHGAEVLGISTPVDANVFRGSAEDFSKLVQVPKSAKIEGK